MLRIKNIKIKNFRSIVSLNIDVLGMNIFVGLNDAGKSNVLKALNLFFNNETEPGVPWDFNVDYSKLATPKRNKAKEIQITLTFEIPKHFKDSEDVIWTKTWRAGDVQPHFDSSTKWKLSSHSKVSILLKRTRYKYVPAVKSSGYFKYLLADLYGSLAEESSSELIKKANEYSGVLSDFTKGIGQKVKKITDIESDLIMPSNQKDIFKELTFMTSDYSGKIIDLSYRGDGIKAIHIPAILKYISESDNRILGSNTIPYTYIWGYEEPENGIELRKCFSLADELKLYSIDIQEFITTHSPGFYRLDSQEDVRVFYTYKGESNSGTKITDTIDAYELHNKVGLMPLITPIICSIEDENNRMKELVSQIHMIDRDTIYVEGITDKEYYEMAIKQHSESLYEKIKNGTLSIQTREESGCGTSLLSEWAIAWMRMHFKNKAYFLLDHDSAGIEAKNKINEERSRISSGFYLKVGMIQPTEDMKKALRIIGANFGYTVEHLLSYDMWRKMESSDWLEYRKSEELIKVFQIHMGNNKTLDDTITELTDDLAVDKLIIKCKARDEKKSAILNYVKNEIAKGNTMVLSGFQNTICELEKYFV